MKIYTELLGNIHSNEWNEIAHDAIIEYVDLDQWTAQKSRFVVVSSLGNEYAVSLERHHRINDGDIIEYSEKNNKLVVLRIQLNDVMVIALDKLACQIPQTIIHIAIELGHAIGNQHWPAIVKGTKVFVPLAVDKSVMNSVMNTHNIENISYQFSPASQVIPYLAPHEIRRLFGGIEPDNNVHHHTELHCH